MADAKSTPSYFLRLTFLGVKMSLWDLQLQVWSLNKEIRGFLNIGGVQYVQKLSSTVFLILELFQIYFQTYNML